MSDLPHTRNVNDVAQQQQQRHDNQRTEQLDDLPPAPSQTEYELTEKMTFGREPGELDTLLQNMATGYFQEEEVACMRKLTDAYYRIDEIEDKYDINLHGFKQMQVQRMKGIVQSSKSRNGFSQKNMKTQRIRSSENVNEFRRDRIDQEENRSALDKLKDAVTGQRGKELAGSAMMDRDQLALDQSRYMKQGRNKSGRSGGSKW